MFIQFNEKNILEKKEVFFREIIQKVQACHSQDEALFCAYTEISKRYHWSRIKTVTHFYQLFIHDIKTLQNMSGFLHCTNLNFILKYILIKSGVFEYKDIKYKWTLIWWFSSHQYLEIKNIKIDIWAKRYWIQYWDYAHYFH